MQDYKFLKDVNFPSDLRKLSENNLQELSNEVRAEMINAVSETGGHLGAGLGVVELTVALHYIFDTPNDKLIWDVGHQTYPHKILTGRKSKIKTLKVIEPPTRKAGVMVKDVKELVQKLKNEAKVI